MKLLLLDKKTGEITRSVLDSSAEYPELMNDVTVADTYHRIYVADDFPPEQIKTSFDPITQEYSPIVGKPQQPINTTVL